MMLLIKSNFKRKGEEMNATIVLVLILPILVVSLVITVDTVFRTLK